MRPAVALVLAALLAAACQGVTFLPAASAASEPAPPPPPDEAPEADAGDDGR